MILDYVVFLLLYWVILDDVVLGNGRKYRSILDLVSKKADHSVLRLLQISQQHIESQLDRIRHERELWKEARHKEDVSIDK